jgi:site-specific DNA-methyltransferase (adenine-specific)
MKLLNGDCLELMKTLPDKSIDLFICDLPYQLIPCDWDIPINLEQFWIQVKRLAKNDHTPIIHFQPHVNHYLQ